jgi:solute:Na+ symporter, SSS family
VTVKGHFGAFDFAVLAAYLLLTAAVGIYFSRQRTTNDFFLGGGRIPWWAAGLSIFGTQLSALTFMAIPAKTYATDWVYFPVNVCVVLVAPVVVRWYLPVFRGHKVVTAYEYLERRFNLAVRLFGSTAFILLQMGRMSIVVFLPAIALSAVTDISTSTSILIMGVFVTLYCMLGGIEAVVWTDVLQVVVLIGGALLSLLFVARGVEGGFATLIATASEDGKFHMFDWTWDHTTTAVWVVLLGNFFSQLIPYTTDQAVVQRYMTATDDRKATRSVWTNAALTIPSSLLFFGVGTALYVFYKFNPGALNPALPADAVFPWFIAQQLPPGVSGLVIAGIFAAAMSTLSSGLNSVATVLVTDFYRRLRRGAPDRFCLKLARGLTLVLGIVSTGTALVMASYPIQSLWDVFLTILGLGGGSVAGVFMLGVFTARANGTGTLVGAGASIFVVYLVQRYTDVHFFLYAVTGVVTCVATGYLASLVIGKKPRVAT